MVAGVRHTSYSGDDKDADAAFRDVNTFIKFVQRLPFVDGAPFVDQDFSSPVPTAQRSYPLRHSLKRKARGVAVMNCTPKPGITALPANVPMLDKAQGTTSVAYVTLSVAMATNYQWSFWVW